MANLLDRAIRNARAMMRSAEFGDSSIPPNSAQPWAGVKGMGQAGLEAAAFSISTVLTCVKALYDDMSVIPFAAYEGEREGAHQKVRNQPRIVTEPFGPDLDVGAGIGQIVVSRSMRGNAYLYVSSVDPDTLLPDQLIVLHPDLVRPTRDSNGFKVFKIHGETYGSFRVNGGPKDRIIHIPGMMPPGAVAGVDVITAQRLQMELTRAVVQYGYEFFGNGGSPSGVVSVPGQGDRSKAREVADIWEAAHGGVSNAHKPAIMFGGAKWEQMSVSPDNAQFLATRQMQREEICGLFNVPQIRIQAIIDNASQGGGAGLEAIDGGYVTHGLLPHGNAIERAWQKLIPGGGRTWSAFNYGEFLRTDAKTASEIDQKHRVTGVRTIDEIRASKGWEPLPDGQGADPFTPLNSNASPTGGKDNEPPPGQGEGEGGTP